ncbi:hypothetical protein [Butyrivibrio sp. FCS014]|uniref:hypothetical protein n=1 Tax=Butyrivibrio sp. FCS014 TaxID=1408304 RepID=UPI0004649C1D|nr:hypothetical protein [Butyrivibrio sp. FCS014]
MPGFEEYQKKIKNNEDVNGQNGLFRSRQMPGMIRNVLEPQEDEEHRRRMVEGVGENTFDFDAEQLKEYFDKRFADEGSFAQRTKYYFKEHGNPYHKQLGYKKLSKDEDNTLVEYSKTYKNQWASKRKSSADDASVYFNLMATKITLYQNDDEDENLSNEAKYKHKEEIMGFRLKGMLAAAEVKSKSGKHEDYLKGRAKLSCAMVLRDQLEHYMAVEKNNKTLDKFRKKLAALNKQISEAYQEIQKAVPKAQDTWRKARKIDTQHIRERKNAARNDCASFNTNSANLLLNLEKIKAECNDTAWPRQIVMKDENGACISRAESRAKQWNAKFDNGSTPELELEAIERFNRIHVPSLEEIEGKGTYKYIMGDIRGYYDLFHRGLSYYQNSNDQTVIDYKNNHPEFEAKLAYLAQAKQYIEYRLKKDNHIIFDAEGNAVVQKDAERQGFPRNAGPNMLRDMRGIYGDYIRSQTFADAESEVQDKQTKKETQTGFDAQMREEKRRKYNLDQNGNPIVQPVAEPVVEPVVAQVNQVNVQQEQPVNQPVNIQQAQNLNAQNNVEMPVFNEGNVKKQREIFENKINVQKEEDKKKEEKKKEEKKKSLAEKYAEALPINLTKDEVNELNKIKETCSDCNEFGYKIYKSAKCYHDVAENKEIKALYEKAVPFMPDDRSLQGIERRALAMMKPVHFDKKGHPISFKDKENHEWNKKYLQTYIDKDDDTREKMICEWIPNLYNGIPLPEMPTKKELEEMKKGNLAAYQEKIDLWAEKLMRTPEFGEMLMSIWAGLSFDYVRKNSKNLQKFYDENPKFRAVSDLFDALSQYLNAYAMHRGGIEGYKPIKKNSPNRLSAKRFAENRVAFLGQGIFEKVQIYMANKDKDRVAYPILSLETKEDQEKEFKTFKKIQPEFTREGYGVYKEIENARRFSQCPEYKDLFDENHMKELGGSGQNIDRDCLAIMRFVKFDKGWNPVSEEDKKNHQWNIKWLKAWRDNDVKLREEMIEQELGHRFEGLEMLPEPTEKDIIEPGDYMLKIDAFIANLIKTGKLGQFMIDGQKGLSIDSLKRMHPNVKKFIDDNPKLYARNQAFDIITNYLNSYNGFVYLFDENGVVGKNKDPKKSFKDFMADHRKMSSFAKLANAANVASSVQQYYQVPESELKHYGKNSKNGKVQKKEVKKQEENPNRINIIEDEKEKKQEKNLNRINIIVEEENKNVIIEKKEEKKGEKKQEKTGKKSKKAQKAKEQREELDPEILSELNSIKLEEIKTEKIKSSSSSSFMTKKEIDAKIPKIKLTSAEKREYKELKEGHSLLNEKGFKLYKETRCKDDVNNHPELKEVYRRACKHIKLKGAAHSIDREVLMVLKPVHYDDKKVPITPADKEAHEWNKRYLQAIADNDMEQREAVVAERIANLYNSIPLPPLPTESQLKKKNNKDKDIPYKEVLEKWCTQIINHKNMAEIMWITTAEGSIDTLMLNHPALKKYLNNNEKLKKKSDLITNLFAYFDYYCVDNAGLFQGEPIQDKDKGSKLETAQVRSGIIPSIVDGLKEYKKVEDEEYETAYEFKLSTEAEREKEFEEHKKIQPGFTRQSERMLRLCKKAIDFRWCPAYKELFDTENMKEQGASGQSIDRDCLAIMRHVSFDKNWQPISEKDQENHRWNLTWLKAWKDKKPALRDKMIAHQLPKTYAGLEDLPRPTEEQLKNPESYKAVVDNYLKKVIEEGDFIKLMVESNRSLSYDSLKKSHPGFKKYFEDNPVFKKRCDAMDTLLPYINNYLQANYLIEDKKNYNPLGFVKEKSQDIHKRTDEAIKTAEKTMPATAAYICMMVEDYYKEKEASGSKK